MRFPEIEALTADLEYGLGKFDRETISGHIIAAQPERLRLTLEGVCGLSCIAISEHLREDGHPVRMVLSKPGFDSKDPEKGHIFMAVEGEQGTTFIDPNYLAPLVYAGITPGYAHRIGKDWVYPERKIAVFPQGGEGPTVALLANTSVFIMRAIEPIGHRPEFQGIGGAGIFAMLSSIYDSQNFTDYTPLDDTYEAGLALSRFITHDHAKLLD